MKKFKYRLAINGEKSQLKSLILKLTELGYEWKAFHEDWSEQYNILTTAYGTSESNPGGLGYISHDMERKDQIIVSASNPNLVLALAAMVDDEELHVGELVTSIEYNWFKDTGGFRIIRKLNGSSADCSLDGESVTTRPDACYIPNLIKATKEEIINHFIPKTMEKKIIGYKLKDNCKQYEEVACKISFGYGATGIFVGDMSLKVDVVSNSLAEKQLRKAGVLNLWFEPVYEENKFKVGDYVFINGRVRKLVVKHQDGFRDEDDDFVDTSYKGYRWATPEEIAAAQTKVITLRCESGTFEIEVSKDRIWYAPEDASLNVGTLREIVRSRVIGKNYSFTPSHIDSGCKKQVPIEDWKKVLKAYDSLNK